MFNNPEDNERDREKEGIVQAEGEILNAEETPPEAEPVTDVEWVPVVRDLDQVQAEILKGDLNTAGIPVVITGSRIDSFQIYPGVENAVLVPSRWEEEAREIVEDFLSRIEEETDTDVCSACGAEVPPDAETCPDCGEVFTEEVSEEDEEPEEEN